MDTVLFRALELTELPVGDKLLSAVNSGLLPESRLDDMARRQVSDHLLRFETEIRT